MQFIRFCLVGGVGFVVDAGLMLTGLWLGFGPLWTRIVSIAAAGLTTWQINRNWTFAHQSGGNGAARQAREALRYGFVQVCGALVNYGVFAMVVTLLERTTFAAMAGLVAGSTCSLVLNFLGAKYLVFRGNGA
ncbi:GtrA family protein [Oceaniglobus roseus]|uniref:GtrA family protein n=1 Tax=Oceaniglobus roseus TaxID=1737570 RepID=UPI0012FFED45|nr:GtrA family protein [Kandeliimicrobium roseum]